MTVGTWTAWCAISATILAACGDAGEKPGADISAGRAVEQQRPEVGTAPDVETPQRIALHATSFRYRPRSVTVGRGAVRFVIENGADEMHGFAVLGSGVSASIPEIGPGAIDSLDVVFPVRGTYMIGCPVGDHGDRGMHAFVRVE